ncbi:MAG TPA: hypothetical protein VJJ80_02805 [Patescibacteria group bacterium]|nr:hypothetical protein [Patescibacteria group bacterium]
MESPVVQISDELFEELRQLWRESGLSRLGYSFHAFPRHLQQKFGIKKMPLQDKLLLYGRARNDTHLSEQLVGNLIAIFPGVVIFKDTSFEHQLDGLMVRVGPTHPSAFILRSFRAPHSSVSLVINVFIKPENYFVDGQICPACISWGIGGGGGSGNTLAIDQNRWEAMIAWLDKWLPPTET